MTAFLTDISVALGLLALLVIALELGFRIGSRDRREGDAGATGQIGAVQGAVLGLLGLLLAFSFAAAGSRFLERQDLITTEANAIGTAALRADLLAEPHRSALRSALKNYTNHRIDAADRLRFGLRPEDFAEVDRMHAEIWSAAIAGVNDRPPTMLSVLAPVNEVFDLHTTRMSSGRKKIPPLVIGVLLGCSLLAMGVMGYSAGLSGRRRAPLTVSLAIIVAASLWITYDLDHPRAGLLQLSEAPLKALKFD